MKPTPEQVAAAKAYARGTETPMQYALLRGPDTAIGPNHVTEILLAALEAAEQDSARLDKALVQVRDDLQCTIDLYNKNGPMWTSRESGAEYYDASFVVDSAQEKIDAIDAARKAQP